MEDPQEDPLAVHCFCAIMFVIFIKVCPLPNNNNKNKKNQKKKNNKDNEKALRERRKHCVLAVVRRSQKYLPRCRPSSRGWTVKI